MGASQSSSDYYEPEHRFEEEEEHDDDDDDDDDDADSSSGAKYGAAVDRLYPDGAVEEFEEEAANGRVMNLRLGALDHSFLVNDTGVQVYRNFNHGLHGKGVFLKFDDGKLVANKAILMKVETDMMLMSQMKEGRAEASSSLHQLDIESGKIVKEWKFEKDGVDITMRDITNDTKGSQLDPSNSTFLGLADNILCQWDMRHRKGMVQSIVSANSPVLHWNHGYLFSRGTNFKCFATSGDGSIFVGSVDGRIRLYSKKSIWQSKTIFPGLGSPITKVDVTFDGEWVLGTTDTYLILICTLLADKYWETEEEGFTERMPILLKLCPQDSCLAGTNKFHGGHFSWVTESGKKEPHIVASVANFSVIWSFQQVKNSVHGCYRNHQKGLKSCYCYMIVMKDESIVESQFMHHNFADSDSLGAPFVVATPMKVSSFKLCLDELFKTNFTV